MDLNRRSLLISAAATGGTAIALANTKVGSLLRLERSPAESRSTGRVVNVREFGAHGDGSSDDRGAIQRAIDSVAVEGGGTVHLPEGTYCVRRSDAGTFAVEIRSNVTLSGNGKKSVIKLADNASHRTGAHTLYVNKAKNVVLRNVVVDGNREKQMESGHCLRSSDVDGLLVQNVVLRNAASYGAGFESGFNKRIRLDGVTIHDTGADGIDFKNKRSGNSAILLTNITIRRWGLRPDLETQAAIDCRGQIEMNGIDVADPGSESAVGVRMRQGEAIDINGPGGHFSTLRQFAIRMGARRRQVGINVVARFVTVSEGFASGGIYGLLVQEDRFRATEMRVHGSLDTGILMDANDSHHDADGSILRNCLVTRCGGDGITVEADNVQIVECTSRANAGYGLLIAKSSTATRVTSGDFATNEDGPIRNLGTASRIALR